MNFYKHYLGDYARDTAHLTLVEHGAYRVMLDTYYATEKPLPADSAALYRICKAFSAAERKSVDMVAKAFFPTGQDGMRHNARADAELADAQAFADAQAKRAHKRWQSHGNAGNDAGAMPPHMPDECRNDASHSHRTTSTTAGKPALPPGFEEFWSVFPRRAGGNPKTRAVKAYRARLRDGHTPEVMLEGARRYAEFIRATGKEGTEYVLQAATFVGSDKRFQEEWAKPGEGNVAPLYRREGVM